MSESKSYARHMNGLLVDVRAFEQPDRGGGVPSTEEAVRHGYHDRPPVVGQPGVFTRGLIPIAKYPLDRDLPFADTKYWFWKNQPVQGLGGVGLSAVDEWSKSIEEGIDHLKLVVANNPGKPLVEMLSRPDVLDALRYAGIEGSKTLSDYLTKLWMDNGGLPDAPYLQSVLSDMQRNGLSFAPRMLDALKSAERSQLQTIISRDQIRAAAAESVIQTRAGMESRLRVYKKIGVTHVKWLTRHKDNIPCSACEALDGSIVSIGEEFDITAGNLNTPVYFDLTCPPRHPSCRCRITPVRV